MIHPSSNTKEYVRGVFIIDPDNKVRGITFNPVEVGRNIDEIKRTVVALQTIESSNVYTPANWQPGQDLIVPYVKSGEEGGNKVLSESDPSLYQVAWYMTMKKAD